jgi:hypothetical protein
LLQNCWPPGTNQAGDKAVQTRLNDGRHLTITFPEEGCPARVVFVMKEGEKWFNSGGGDFVAHLKPPGVDGALPAAVAMLCLLCFAVARLEWTVRHAAVLMLCPAVPTCNHSLPQHETGAHP